MKQKSPGLKDSTGLSFFNLQQSKYGGFDIGQNEISSIETLHKIKNMKKKLNANVGLTKTN